MDWQALGRGLIIAGILLAIVGVLVMWAGRIPFLGKLPGDIFIRRDHFSFYFPLTTCLVLSAILTIVMHFLSKK